MTDCHVEKYLHMRNVKKIYHIEKALHMINSEQNEFMRRNVEKSVMWTPQCGEMFPQDRLLHMNKITFFVAKSVLLQFTLFCRKKIIVL